MHDTGLAYLDLSHQPHGMGNLWDLEGRRDKESSKLNVPIKIGSQG